MKRFSVKLKLTLWITLLMLLLTTLVLVVYGGGEQFGRFGKRI